MRSEGNRKTKIKSKIIIIAILASSAVHVAAVELGGELVQGGLVYGQVDKTAEVFLDGRKLRVSDTGIFIFGFGPDAPSKSVLRIDAPTGGGSRVLTVRRREYEVQRIDGLPPSQVTPSPEVHERIRQEAKLIARARRRDLPLQVFPAEFIWPVHGVITGVYGSRRILNGEPRRPHYGIDIAAALGTPVKAPLSGRVSLVHDGMYFSGATLVLDHGHGVSSSFLHLSEILVEVGDWVDQEQVIAKVGTSGRSTGPHLDWRVNWFDRRLDPALLAGEMPTL